MLKVGGLAPGVPLSLLMAGVAAELVGREREVQGRERLGSAGGLAKPGW